MKDSQIEGSESTKIHAQVFLKDVTHPYYYAQNALPVFPSFLFGTFPLCKAFLSFRSRHALNKLSITPMTTPTTRSQAVPSASAGSVLKSFYMLAKARNEDEAPSP